MIRIREALLDDVPRFVGLPRDGEAGGDSRMLQYLKGEHHPQHALAPRIMFVAEAGDEPIGYVAGHLTRRFECDGELQWIYVVPSHRGTGIATELLRRMASWFVVQGAHRVCVDVGDEAARPFYARHGAVELDRHWMVWREIADVAS